MKKVIKDAVAVVIVFLFVGTSFIPSLSGFQVLNSQTDSAIIGSLYDTPPVQDGTRFIEDRECIMYQLDSPSSSNYHIRWVDQDGTFHEVSTGSGNVDPDNLHLTSGDWDGDGRDDIIFVVEWGGLNKCDIWIFDEESNSIDEFNMIPYIGHITMGDIDADGKDECIIYQLDSPSSSNYHIRWVDQDGTFHEVSTGSGNVDPDNLHLTSGDWDGDGRDDIIFVVEWGGLNKCDIWIFDEESNSIDEFNMIPYIGHITMGDINGDSVKVDYQSYLDVTTEYHPLVLLYRPPFMDRVNYDGSHSEYSYTHSGGDSTENSVGVTAKVGVSYEGGIPMVLTAKFGVEVEAGIENAYGHSVEKSITTGFGTQELLEPYVVVEQTTYRQYKYKIINGQDNNKEFSIDIPTSVTKSIVSLSTYNSNINDAPSISSRHTTGDPTSYTTQYTSDTESETVTVGEGDTFLRIDFAEDEWGSLTLHAGVSLTAGISAGGFNFDYTVGLYNDYTHTISIGEETHFYGQINGIRPGLRTMYLYDAIMYLSRDSNNKYVIIDYYVPESSLGSAYSDTSPPETTIQSHPDAEIEETSCNFEWTGSDAFTPTDYLEYQYKLDNQDWSTWDSQTSKSYTGLSENTHTFQVRARDLNNNVDPSPAEWTFTVGSPPEDDPVLNYSPSTLDFDEIPQGESSSKTFEVWNDGDGTLEYSIDENLDWINVNPSQGSSTGEHDSITVTLVDTDSVSLGPHSGQINIDSDYGSGTIDVYVFIVEYEPKADLKCSGSFDWNSVDPGSTKSGTFTVKNDGDPGTELDWHITDYPGWGDWTFSPNSGEDLTPEDGIITVSVTVTAPNVEQKTYRGNIEITNLHDDSDKENISTELTTPRDIPIFNFILDFLENHPFLYQRITRLFV